MKRNVWQCHVKKTVGCCSKADILTVTLLVVARRSAVTLMQWRVGLSRFWHTTKHIVGHIGDGFSMGQKTQPPTLSKHWRKIRSWGLGFNLNRSTPPCYNDTTYMQYDKITSYTCINTNESYAQWNEPSAVADTEGGAGVGQGAMAPLEAHVR